MSKKLKAAMLASKVEIRSKQTGEVTVRYLDRNKKRAQVKIAPFATIELVPRRTDAKLLQFSNLERLVKLGAVAIEV